jgi:hypothetical protein
MAYVFPLLNLFLGISFFEAIANGIVFRYSSSFCSLLVYRKATDFYKLILYPATLVKLFMVSRSFLVEFLGLLELRSCHLQIRIIWPLLFQFIFLLFLLPDLLFWLGIPSLCWIRIERVDIWVSFTILEEIVSVFSHLNSNKNRMYCLSARICANGF